MTKMISIPERQYAGLMAQASFLRAAVYALGGHYEVSFEMLTSHGTGEVELAGDPERQTVSIKLIQGSKETPPPDALRCATTGEDVASAASAILSNPDATKAEKSVAASALTQKRGRKRITEPNNDDNS